MSITNYATNMPYKCPKCSYSRSWSLRRNKRKCKKCRCEFSPRIYFTESIRSTEKEWKDCIRVFLRERTISRVSSSTSIGHCRVERMLSYLRECMSKEIPNKFKGPVELDETYIGGQRKNKKLHIRRFKAKRGHGTDKIPIVGLFDRSSKKIYVEIIPKLDIDRIFEITKDLVAPRSSIYTDGYKMYRGFPRHGYFHEFVDHDDGEYVRGSIHTNNIEGFWGILKRKLGCIGGIRRKHMSLFIAEIVWKFNHRNEPLDVQESKLLQLLKS